MFEVSRSRVFMLFPSLLWVNRNKKEKFWLHIFRVPVCPYARMPVCPYARMPVYRVLFRLKFSPISSHMIKCLLTKFDGASAENIWLGVMRKRPRFARSVGHDPEPNIFFPSGPSTQWISAQYVGFVRHTFITHDAIEHKKWKVIFLFLIGNVRL